MLQRAYYSSDVRATTDGAQLAVYTVKVRQWPTMCFTGGSYCS